MITNSQIKAQIVKLARTMLNEHQERALHRLKENGGLVINHSTGSGKTLTFLEAVYRAQKENPTLKSLIIAPASLTKNIDKEIDKHKIPIDKTRLIAMSYQKATKHADELAKEHFSIAVADEGHKLRNTTTKGFQKLRNVIQSSDQRLIATATPTYNKASDIAPLVNLVAGGKILPQDADFDKAFVDKKYKKAPLLKRMLGAPPKEDFDLKNKKPLGKALSRYVDTYDVKGTEDAKANFPSFTDTTHEVPMTKRQQRVYNYLEGKLPFYLRMRVRMNLPMDKKDKAHLNAFTTGIRQASNSTTPFERDMHGEENAPKITKAVQSLIESAKQDKNFRGVVYSNFLGAGLNEYSKRLEANGIPHNVFTGKLNSAEKARMVEEYNSGKTPVLLISSSGAEGLDLKGTKKIQVLDPHFNNSKIQQVIGRGIRYKSHEHLPENERHVEVERFHTVFPRSRFTVFKPTSIDSYLHNNSDVKTDFNQKLLSTIQPYAYKKSIEKADQPGSNEPGKEVKAKQVRASKVQTNPPVKKTS